MNEAEKPSSGTTESNGGGFFKNNGGLLIGGAMAMLALFGMEGSFLPSLIAGAALIVGFLADKDNGVFGGLYSKIFGKEEASQPSTEIAKEKNTNGVGANDQTVAKPAPPTVEPIPSTTVKPQDATATEPDAQPQVGGSKIKNGFTLGIGENPVHFDIKGDVVHPPFNDKNNANLMEIKVDKTGKATGVAVANEKGHFDRNDKGEVILTKPIEEIRFNLKPDDKNVMHVYLADNENKEMINKLRKIGTEALLERTKSKGINGSSIEDNGNVQSASLDNIQTQSSLPNNIKGSYKSIA
jgi:hypothetical protein